MEKPSSYFDWKLNFRNNQFPKNLHSQTRTHSFNEFNELLKNSSKRESIIKSGGISSSQISFKNMNLIDGIIRCTIRIPPNEEYQVEINKEKKYIDHKCREFLNLNKFKKYFCSHLVRIFFLLKENDELNTIKLLKHIHNHDYDFFPNFRPKKVR